MTGHTNRSKGPLNFTNNLHLNKLRARQNRITFN